MKFADIEREFTKKVMEQLNAGKRIHAQAMGGSQGAATIKAAMERRNPDAHFDVGPKSIVFSDELILLEFEPNEIERIEIERKKRALQAACREVEHPTPEWIRQIVGGIPK